MTLHPDLRQALAAIRAAGEANWYVLTAYILHANARGRAWPSLDTLSRETGYGRPAVIAARQWLIRAGALTKVNYALRIGDERTFPRKEVMQLSGVIRLPGRAEPLRILAVPAPSEDTPEGLAGLPWTAGSAPRVTLDGYPGIPESTAATAAAAGSPGDGGDAPAAVAPSPTGVGLVWQQEARQPLTPLLAEVLGELVERHGAETVVGAVREAVQAVGPGKFSVKYVIRILERWRAEGQPGDEVHFAKKAEGQRGGGPHRRRKKTKERPPVDFAQGRTQV